MIFIKKLLKLLNLLRRVRILRNFEFSWWLWASCVEIKHFKFVHGYAQQVDSSKISNKTIVNCGCDMIQSSIYGSELTPTLYIHTLRAYQQISAAYALSVQASDCWAWWPLPAFSQNWRKQRIGPHIQSCCWLTMRAHLLALMHWSSWLDDPLQRVGYTKECKCHDTVRLIELYLAKTVVAGGTAWRASHAHHWNCVWPGCMNEQLYWT